ncbi:NAD-dependent epimerase/dehydratase family protein [Citreimonas salinaria]|uniref:dTDP-4-dehydrorhamnose reductase n=1 Tax=Citreimonas salinaria TaxID=321339 RepID=A0A1H3FDU1_9RHOB|nr:NAD-dependent epimerase/dehydratase family protein [Citreimonas salinaria]SDX89065.1 dTDP-4-dehydrorhamnose reductase [Citreimonas salinaria]
MAEQRPIPVLLLGATGKVGRMLRHPACAEALSGIELIPVGRRGATIRWAPGDDPAALPRAECVLALWGVTAGDRLEDNTALALQAAAVARAVGARRVLHASTAAVYAPAAAPHPEGDPMAPAGAYGAAKAAMEGALLRRVGGGVEHVRLRIGNVAGADSLFASLSRGGAVTLDRFADGQGPVRSYIGPVDLTRVLAALVRAPALDGVLNVAAPGAVPMQALVRAAGTPLAWREAPAGAIRSLVLDTARLSRLCSLGDGASDPGAIVAQARAVGALR